MTKGADVKAKSNVCVCENEEIYIDMMKYTARYFFPDAAATSYLCCDIELFPYILNYMSLPLHDENDMFITMFVPDKY